MRRIFTLVLLLVGLHSLVSAQTTNGIHVKRGCSYDSIVSSNIGTACNATGQYSFAGGFQTHASGQASFAFGISSQATQKNSFAFGQSVQATHQNTFVIGQNAEASQQCSFAMGKGVQASGSYSMSFGFYASAQQNRCIVIGSGVDSQNPMAVTSSGITLGMGSTLPTMYVSEASGAQKTGKVAIGNVTPVAKLHIRSNWKNALSVKTNGAVTLNGRVGVNTENSTTDYALAVDGGVLTTKVHIQDVNDWPDYVFEDDYQSIPISELKEYIAVYRHLPGVPSEAEVRERGYDVSGMQAVLLEKIEELTLYIEMARACGIRMMDSGMIRCEGVNHFLTYRFDRAGNDKLFSQTLMALYPSADSYESFLYVVRRLGLGYPDVVEAFRRMVFNVMARNVDDHAKNFSFLMNRKGQWSLAPAYDLTFSMDLEALPFENYHAFSVNSKVSDITEEDMIEVAVSFDLKKADARRVIGEVRSSVRKFPEIAQRNGVSRDWIEKVSACLEEPVR